MQFRLITPLFLAFTTLTLVADDADVPRLVYRQSINFRSLPVSALRLEGADFVVTQAVDNIPANTRIPAAAVQRVSGSEPEEITKATALMLTGTPAAAAKQLAPLLESQRSTATVPGNFWVTAARLRVIAAAMDGDSKSVDTAAADLISTSKVNSDPTPILAQIILDTRTGKIDERLQRYDDFISENRPPMINGLAQFLRADILAGAKRDKDALDGFLAVPALNPTASAGVVAGSEFRAAQLLVKLNRKPEAIATYRSIVGSVPGSALAEKSAQNLKSIE